MTWTMPISVATALAVVVLSPLSRTGSIPSLRNSAIAPRLVGRMESATAMAPCRTPSQATATTVAPRPCAPSTKAVSQGAASAGASKDDCSHEWRPTRTSAPSTLPRTPRPRAFWNSVTGTGGPSRSAAAWVMALATGCSLACSTAPALANTASGSAANAATSITVIRPVVMVPVLSSTTVSTLRVLSRTSGPRMMIPICAPRPVPTSSAVGVASPKAHGQAMMRTATAAVKAS